MVKFIRLDQCKSGTLHQCMWAAMFQGGEGHLQCTCGGFDSLAVHQVRVEGSLMVKRKVVALVTVGSSPIPQPKRRVVAERRG